MNPVLETTIDRYAAAWNRHDVDAILALHTEDAVFENHTSGGLAVGKVAIRKLASGLARLCIKSRAELIRTSSELAFEALSALAPH
jgi:ketosteroid isomerase-like protein